MAVWRGGISAGRASLQGANLRHADLRHANLRGAALEGAQLSGSQADQATIWLKGFDPGQRDQRARRSGEAHPRMQWLGG